MSDNETSQQSESQEEQTPTEEGRVKKIYICRTNCYVLYFVLYSTTLVVRACMDA